jgi:hypothetical protein
MAVVKWNGGHDLKPSKSKESHEKLSSVTETFQIFLSIRFIKLSFRGSTSILCKSKNKIYKKRSKTPIKTFDFVGC